MWPCAQADRRYAPEYQSINGARKKPGEDRKEGGGDRAARGVGKEQFAPYSPERSKELDD